jgi:16S rRNA (uracil1498-N3)-methyltransferase
VSRRRFFVDQVSRNQAVIAGERAHHLRHVLRVQAGQVFELSDARRLYLARVTGATNSAVTFAVEEELPAPAALPDVSLLAAVFKFDRFEWMLEKVTELGVTRVTPVIAARTDRGLARGVEKRLERWRRIVEEAAQQARRLAPPGVAAPQSLSEVLEAAPAGTRWMLDEAAAGLAGAGAPAAVVLSGPEGGFTDAERDAAVRSGFQPVSLGPLILRAETAPVAALAIASWWRNTMKENG